MVESRSQAHASAADEADQIEAESIKQVIEETDGGPADLSQMSVAIDDPALQRLYDWVAAHGGVFNCESRADVVTGVRGLYATKDFSDPQEPVIQIPSKLIVSPYHISRKNVAEWADGCLKYSTVFEERPEVFHSKYPLEPNDNFPEKLENEYGEYFQVTLFLIIERLKQEQSMFKPFLDYLPPVNDTIFTIDPDTPVGPQCLPGTTLITELQNAEDDIHRWIQYDR